MKHPLPLAAPGEADTEALLLKVSGAVGEVVLVCGALLLPDRDGAAEAVTNGLPLLLVLTQRVALGTPELL